MPQSLAKLYTHLVFSTKNRRNCIDDAVGLKLHAYMAGILNGIGCPCLLINSMSDHAHVLFVMSRTMSLSDVVKNLKSGSTAWIHREYPLLRDFHWQTGYAAFSVSQSAVEPVTAYIADQKAHHAQRDFQSELRTMLRQYGIDFDERYLWK